MKYFTKFRFRCLFCAVVFFQWTATALSVSNSTFLSSVENFTAVEDENLTTSYGSESTEDGHAASSDVSEHARVQGTDVGVTSRARAEEKTKIWTLELVQRPNNHREYKDTLEMFPEGYRRGRFDIIPEMINCTHRSDYAEGIQCPTLEITDGTSEAYLQYLLPDVTGKCCTKRARPRIKKEAYRKTDLWIVITCSNERRKKELKLKIEIRKKEQSGVYKATLIAVVCFSVVVIGLFLVFICNRAFFHRRQSENAPYEDLHRQGSDLYSVSDRLARLRLVDKPPTYADVLTADRMQRGVPPPAYSSTEESSSVPGPSGTARSTPEIPTQERNLIGRLASRLNQLREFSQAQNQTQNRSQAVHIGPLDNEAYVSET